jgi:hypothetical protein
MASKMLVATVLAASLGLAMSVEVLNSDITLAQALKAQSNWCAALVKISKDYDTKGLAAAKYTAGKAIDGAYAYQYGPVAFKPTLTTGSQTFRTTREGALAYFVGDNPNYPNDTGFALKHWRTCKAYNSVVQIYGNRATTMGNVFITNDKGEVTKVDKTWNFLKDNDGTIRITLHHSSLPYAG